MQTAFSEAILGASHRVFGYRLHPLSAAHILWLDAVESPIMTDGKCSPDDLLVAAKVCSSPVASSFGAFVPMVGEFKATIRDQWRLSRIAFSRERFSRECLRWANYCEDYLAVPSRMETPGKSARGLSAPAVLGAVVMGVKLFGEARAWSMPYGLLRTYLDVYAETQGADVRFEPGKREAAEIEAQLAEAEAAGREFLKQIQGDN